MNTQIKHDRWAAFIKFYTDQNRGRKTRLGSFERQDAVTHDYWLEDGLQLLGLDMETTDGGRTIQIVLDGYTHSVPDVRTIRAQFVDTGEEDGIDIECGKGAHNRSAVRGKLGEAEIGTANFFAPGIFLIS